MNEIRTTIDAQFNVSADDSGQRLDQVTARLLPEHSRSRIQGWIKSGELTVNGRTVKAKDKVLLHDEIVIAATVLGDDRWRPEAIDLDILFEDDQILVINKPAGLVVHPAAGHRDGTLVNALLHHAPELDHLPRAGIVHRLDKDTSGVMVVARSLKAHTALVKQLQDRSMGREYDAVVLGELTGGGTVDAPMGRHPQQRKKMAIVRSGKPAVTHYRLLQRFPGHSHIRCKLETGRTHQIRVHMAHQHHALVGDPVYGNRVRPPKGADDAIIEALRQFRRQALHARLLTLDHPVSGERMTWQQEMPEDMQALLTALGDFRDRQSARNAPL
ncbi:MAG: 23S rRNA pseudouridine(1911/1915/1917) synthase RluD [Halomonadaceae bacterium]|nr:MAG: 23S rRNA pseudouridine(1911/1915/1917) synthase RluD [Halomonadaceae bacterium]